MQTITGIVILLNSIPHTIHFLVSWQFVNMEEMPYKTTLLNGKINSSRLGIRITGILWLLGSAGFIVTGLICFILPDIKDHLIISICIYSFVLCILNWPETKTTLTLNVIIIGLLLLINSSG